MSDDFVLADFRAAFQEFTEAGYPDAMVNFWAGVGDSLLNIRRWRTRRVFGLQLFVAHKITLAKQNQITPGAGSGVVSSTSVGPISESIDTQAGIIQGAGDYNKTSYGVQFYQLSEIVGLGGTCVI